MRQMDQRLSSDEVMHEVRPRRHHTKSRKGCSMCKRRKIKVMQHRRCDERKPICTNCARRGTPCSFGRVETAKKTICADRVAPVSHLRSTSVSTPDQVPDEADRQISESASDTLFTQLSTPIQGLELIHLELLHNYLTLTSQTLSGDPLLRNVWRINVPNVGFTNDFVLRSIFALSALHMSLYSSKRREFFLGIARSEHGAALHEITSVLSSVTAKNCSAVYIAAVLTFFYAWACPRMPEDFFLVSNSSTAEWVFLLKGVRSITESWRPELRDGPFSPMFRLGSNQIEHLASMCLTSAAWLSTVEHARLIHLRQIIVQTAIDAQAAKTYDESITNLETCFCAVNCSSRSSSQRQMDIPSSPSSVMDGNSMPVTLTSNVYSWLYKMSDHFVELLTQRDRSALVIFAHFCVLLKYLGNCWWMQGWSTHLLQEIWDLLDEEHRLWIRWPIEEVGWVPKD